MALKVTTPERIVSKGYKRNLLLYAPSGAGKTTLAASATRPLILSVDPNGTDSLLGTPLGSTPVVVIGDYPTFKDTVEEICRKPPTSIDTIIVDTASTLQVYDLSDQRAALSGREKASQNEFALSNQRLIDPLVKLLRKSGKHVTIICHERTLRNEKGEVIHIGPDIQPGTLNAFKRLLSAVFFLEDKSSKTQSLRILHTTSKGTLAETKRRVQLPDTFTNPTWQTVEKAFDKFYTQYVEDSEEVMAAKQRIADRNEMIAEQDAKIAALGIIKEEK